MLEKIGLGNIAVLLAFFVLFLRSRGSIGPGLFQILVGLFILTGLIFYFYLKGKAVKDAAQARKFQYTVLESRLQETKSPIPHSPPIFVSLKIENVVIQQNSAPLPDRDNSQVSPHRPPPDYYKTLGISHSANLEEIKQAAKTKGNNIKTAFAVLSQADQRTTYDAKPNLGPHNHYATLSVKKLASTAEIKTAAQARMNEIKEAYENLSKPETRATYDSSWQAAKAPLPHSLSIIIPPKRENVVIEQKPVPPLDKDKSQGSSSPSPPVSLTDAARHTKEIKLAEPAKHTVGPNRARGKDRNTTEIELAGRGTRLMAVIVDAFIVAASVIIFSVRFFNILNLDSGSPAAFLVVELSITSVLITNLVLLYRHGQTLGKRLLSIKIVDVDGSRAGLLRILLARGLVIVPFFIFAILTKGLVLPILIVLLESLLIFQNSQRCLHDMIANTTVVKVFPGKNDSPYGSLTGTIGTITLVFMVPLLLVFAKITSTDAYDLRRAKVVAEVIESLNALKAPAEKHLRHDSFRPLGREILRTDSKFTVSLVSNPEEFYFEATMSKEDTVLSGQIVRVIYHPDTKTWSCSAAYPNGIPQKYLPNTCK